MNWYLDSSVALHAVLTGGDPKAQTWIESSYGINGGIYSSTLLHLEMSRVLKRERLDLAVARPVLDRVSLISLDDGIVSVAAAFEVHMKSLDAIHLATSSLLGFGVTVVTHDEQMKSAAKHLGIETFDPLLD